MSVTFPRTDILNADFSDQTFQLQSRQEYSRTASGVTIGKDYGPAIWMASYTTKPMPASDAVRYEALLNSLNGVINTFEAGDLRRPYPVAHADGDFDDTGEISAVAGKTLSLKSLPAGLKLSIGDYIAFTRGNMRALHQIMEDVTAAGDGTTAAFEVRPPPWPDTAADTSVTLKNPRGVFVMMPGTVKTQTQNGIFTVVSFQAGQIVYG